MRFARIGQVEGKGPDVVIGDGHVNLRTLASDIDAAILAAEPLENVSKALGSGELLLHTGEDRKSKSPTARPVAVVCVGMNYVAHAAKSGAEPPTPPDVFLKTPFAVGALTTWSPNPLSSARTGWEVEIGVVIDRKTSYLRTLARRRSQVRTVCHGPS